MFYNTSRKGTRVYHSSPLVACDGTLTPSLDGCKYLLLAWVDSHYHALAVDEEGACGAVGAPVVVERCAVLMVAEELIGGTDAVGSHHLVKERLAAVEVHRQLLHAVVACGKLAEPDVLDACHGVGRRPHVHNHPLSLELVEGDNHTVVANSKISSTGSHSAITGNSGARRGENQHCNYSH